MADKVAWVRKYLPDLAEPEHYLAYVVGSRDALRLGRHDASVAQIRAAVEQRVAELEEAEARHAAEDRRAA